jgi:hypothetical protein
MPRYWVSPVYRLRAYSGKRIDIDVTTSVAPGIPPHKVLREHVIPYFKRKKVDRVLDFGAGALRHTIPMLSAGFEVCAVEYEEVFKRPAAARALELAKNHKDFLGLLQPKDFIKNRCKFDAAILSFVLQVMPIAKERRAVLKYIYKKLRADAAYLLYMSRFGQMSDAEKKYKVNDGYYRWPDRKLHSFYTEFRTAATHGFFKKVRFRRLKSLSARGTEQVILYGKSRAVWP